MAFDFENLVLLIGTNPLPNYVVAEFFLKNNLNLKNVFLIHSEETKFQEGTKQQAENLEKVLQPLLEEKGLNFPLMKIGLSDVGNAAKTIQELTKKFAPLLESAKGLNRIHLNYTGGTKVMCVHVYRFLETRLNDLLKSRVHCNFSYFDGRTFKIVDDMKEAYISDDLRHITQITFDEIIRMHGFKFIGKRGLSPISNEVMIALEEQVKAGSMLAVNTQIRDFYTLINDIKQKPLEERLHLAETLGLNEFGDGPLFPIIQSMPERCRFLDKTGVFDCSKLDNDFRDFTNFLNGIWLEHYIYYVLLTGFASVAGVSVDGNWKIKKEGWGTDFQLDVILKKGFQLVGISCTITIDKATCKQKGFEIFHRTRQIGGDESRAIVVTLLDDDTARVVENELHRESGCPEGYIKVFGEKDLKSDYLLKRVKEFLK